MTVIDASEEVQFAIDLVRESSELARKIQSEMVTRAIKKEDRSPVTVADLAIQALAGKRIQDAFSGIELVGEESAAVLESSEGREVAAQVLTYLNKFHPGASSELVKSWIDRGQGKPRGRFWTIDPIDGTKGFLRDAQYAIALALVEEGKVQLGVLGCPRLSIPGPDSQEVLDTKPAEVGSILVAARGHGCWLGRLNENGFSKTRVSECDDCTNAVVLRSVEPGHVDSRRMRSVIQSLGIRRDPLLLDSQAKYALIAVGRGDLLFRLPSPNYREKMWDHAAGSLIVEEAGGKVSDIGGQDLDFTTGRTLNLNFGVLASNKQLHQTALSALHVTQPAAP